MRSAAFIVGLSALCIPVAVAPQASARPSAQSAHCMTMATHQHLTGRRRTDFIASCRKGPLAKTTPTAPSGTSKESQAITKPSGVDRTTRANQCDAEADRKGLAAKDRKAFQLSCLATAGPVSEGETGQRSPHPAHEIKGIGVNNYKSGAPAAASAPTKPHP